MFRDFADLERVHFVGVGGAGMSGIAEVLLDYDLKVSGSDQASSETTTRLEAAGVRFSEGHDAAQVEGADLVVVSSAVPATNPEIEAAKRLGIPVVRRAEMLGELMRLKYGIAIAGTHGKTTTTSLAGLLLTEGGLDPTVIVGGRLRVTGTGARLGRSDYMVVEADEFDRSFLRLSPIIAVLTKTDLEHLDTYRGLDDLKKAFIEFARRVPFFGEVLLCLDDPNLQAILPDLSDRRVVTYGLTLQAEIVATDVEADAGGSRFGVRHSKHGDLGKVRLPMPGRHNVQNALAAIAVGLALGLEFENMAASLAGFSGVHRRFERLGEWQGAAVIDDYAHHPTEDTATLRAAREVFPEGRLHAVFQPHLYSRTQHFAGDFGRALLAADDAIVTEIYGSREEPLAGVTGEMIVRAARESGHRSVRFCAEWKDVPSLLDGRVGPGDAVLTMGAGDIYRLSRLLVEEAA